MPPPMSDDEYFVAKFEACRWPLEKWHHRDHVKLAYLYLRRYGLGGASAKLRAAIRAHNATHKIPDSPTSGYHETMTQAWLRLVHLVLCAYGPAGTAAAVVAAH